MRPDEAWVALMEHHQQVEAECEVLRMMLSLACEQLREVERMFPGISIDVPVPPPTTPALDLTTDDVDEGTATATAGPSLRHSGPSTKGA